jgi:ribosomal protein S3
LITAQKNKQIRELKSRLKHKDAVITEKTEMVRQLGEKLTQQQFELSELRLKLVKIPAPEASADAAAKAPSV